MLDFVYKTKPYDHQDRVLKDCWSTIDHALFLEMGCGKSKILLDNIAILYNKGRIDSALIVAPKGVYDNWVSGEIPAHMPDYIKTRVYKWSPSETKKNQAQREEILGNSIDLTILVMNVEAFSTQLNHQALGELRA
jgi:hypothetical protein